MDINEEERIRSYVRLSQIRKESWEQAPFSFANIFGIRPYYLNPKSMNKEDQKLAWDLLTFHGIIPQKDVVAPNDMKTGNYPIKKGDLVWAVGEKFDATGQEISKKDRQQQIQKLHNLWQLCQNSYNQAMQLLAEGGNDLLISDAERQEATEHLQKNLPFVSLAPIKGLQLIQEDIDDGADVNAIYREEKSPIMIPLAHVAAQYGNINFLKSLDKKGINWNQTDHIGNTPATMAFFARNESAIRFLLEKKVDFTQKNKLGKAPLDYYWPPFIGNEKLRATLNQMKEEMDEKEAAQGVDRHFQIPVAEFGPDLWDDVPYRKENKLIHGHRINIQHFSDKQKERLENQLKELGIFFQVGTARQPSKTVQAGELHVKVSDPKSIEKLRRFYWGWEPQDSERFQFPIAETVAPKSKAVPANTDASQALRLKRAREQRDT